MSPVSAVTSVGGRYRLDHRVARGRSADVWRATDLELSRPVAVKLPHARFGSDAEAIARFRVSARRAASLVHEGIVRVFDYGEPGSPDAGGRPFLVMELVDGPSLADLLAGGPVGAARAMGVIAQVAAALDVAHRAGLVHGDIGPHNILLSRDGSVKLTGFGAARVAGPGSRSAAGDLYALGVVAHLCLTGSRPPGDAAVPSLPGQIPAPVAEFVSQLTAPELAGRPATAAEAGRRAAQLRDQLAPASPAGPRVAPVSRPARLARPAAAGTLLAATMPDTPGRRRRPAAASRHGRVAMRAFAVIAITLMAAALLGVLNPHGSAPQASDTTKIATVSVRAADLIGRPVQVVRLRLERLGLVVRLRWQPSTRVSPDKVLSLRPAGLLPAHSLITLIGSIRPSAAASTGPGTARASKPARHRRLPRATPRRPGKQPPRPAPSTSPASSPAPSPTPSISPSPTGDPPPATSPPASPPPSGSPPPPG